MSGSLHQCIFTKRTLPRIIAYGKFYVYLCYCINITIYHCGMVDDSWILSGSWIGMNFCGFTLSSLGTFACQFCAPGAVQLARNWDHPASRICSWPTVSGQVISAVRSVRSTVFFALEKHPIKYVKITCREGQQDQITVPSALFCKSYFNFASNASDTHRVRIPGWLFEEVTWFAVLQCLANKEPGQNQDFEVPSSHWFIDFSTPWPKHACANYILVGIHTYFQMSNSKSWNSTSNCFLRCRTH